MTTVVKHLTTHSNHHHHKSEPKQPPSRAQPCISHAFIVLLPSHPKDPRRTTSLHPDSKLLKPPRTHRPDAVPAPSPTQSLHPPLPVLTTLTGVVFCRQPSHVLLPASPFSPDATTPTPPPLSL
ncbi:hypothetical protein M0R45_002856 [Rubus argutus]|uniref:Uncharacterized protein n=1 Tax=Rubus argutus TaxID=59490 RepID=A0AAW1VLV6_RUBAR